MRKTLTALVMSCAGIVIPAHAQTTVSTILSGEARGFQVNLATTPNPFSFSSESDVVPNGVDVISDEITISGITETVTASISDLGSGGEPRFSVNGGAYGSTPVQVDAGDLIRIAVLPEVDVYGATYTAELTVGGGSATFEVTTLTPDPVSITISSGTVPDAERDAAYSGFDFTSVASVSGGPPSDPAVVGDLTWTLASGLLPNGMSISESGQLTGTPSEIGSFSFVIQAAINAESASASYTIIVNDPDGSFVIEGG